MIGFVSAISGALAVIILMTVSALVGYIDSIAPRVGLAKISDLQYAYVMKNIFIRNDSMVEFSLIVSDIEEKEKISLNSVKIVCNYGFNLSEREVDEILTYNYVRLNLWYKDTVDVEKVNSIYYGQAINYCEINMMFDKK